MAVPKTLKKWESREFSKFVLGRPSKLVKRRL
jgi:hypothetical protein